MPVCFLGTLGHSPRSWGGPDRTGKQMTQLPGNGVSFSLAAASPSSHPGHAGMHRDTLLPQRVSPSPPPSPVGFGSIHPCHATCGVMGEKILGGSDSAAGIPGGRAQPSLANPTATFLLSREPESLPAASQHDPRLSQELRDHNQAPSWPRRQFGTGSAAYTDPPTTTPVL